MSGAIGARARLGGGVRVDWNIGVWPSDTSELSEPARCELGAFRLKLDEVEGARLRAIPNAGSIINGWGCTGELFNVVMNHKP